MSKASIQIRVSLDVHKAAEQAVIDKFKAEDTIPNDRDLRKYIEKCFWHGHLQE